VNRRVALGLTVVWLAVLCASARAVMLRYTPKVGGKASYQYAVTSTIDATMAGERMHSQSFMQMTATHTVLAKTSRGMRVEVAMRNRSMAMTMPGSKGPTNQKMPDSTATVVIDQRGHTERVKAAGQDRAAMSHDPLSDIVDSIMLPGKDVKPGDTWFDTLDTKGGGAAPAANITFTSRLVELTTRRRRRCAKITTTFMGTMGGAGAPGSGNVQGTAVQYYDYENSLWVEAEAKLTITRKIPAAKGAKAPGGSTLTRITTTMKLKK